MQRPGDTPPDGPSGPDRPERPREPARPTPAPGPPIRGSRRRSQAANPAFAAAAAVLLLIVTVWAVWFWLRTPDDPSPPPESVVTEAPAPDVAPLDLPPLEASDVFVRELVTRLSEHPQLAAWLVSTDLVHRFVVAVVNVAAYESPSERLEFLVPEEEFQVRESAGRQVIDPASYRRYNLLAETLTSLDTEGTATLYRQLLPLFEEAHRELGFPEGTFNESLAQAMENLLAVEVPSGPIEVTPSNGVWEFRNPGLEARSDAEKHLIRMGPENARRVQAKLRELTDAMGMRLPSDGG